MSFKLDAPNSQRVLHDSYRQAGCLLYRRLGTGGDGISQTAFAAVLTILVEGHEGASTALGSRAFTTEAYDLAVGLDLIVLQDRHLDLLTLVLNLLGGLISSSMSHVMTFSNGTGSRCTSSSSSFWHHRGVGGPSGGWTPSECYWESVGYYDLAEWISK